MWKLNQKESIFKDSSKQLLSSYDRSVFHMICMIFQAPQGWNLENSLQKSAWTILPKSQVYQSKTSTVTAVFRMERDGRKEGQTQQQNYYLRCGSSIKKSPFSKILPSNFSHLMTGRFFTWFACRTRAHSTSKITHIARYVLQWNSHHHRQAISTFWLVTHYSNSWEMSIRVHFQLKSIDSRSLKW